MTKHALAAAFLLLAPLALQAQRGEDTIPRTHIFPALGIHVGTPQKVSAAVGVVLGEDWQEEGRDHSRNVALFAEPGLGGGRASLAYIRHGYGAFGSGFGIAGTVIRTWKDPWTVEKNQTYVGADLILWPILFVGPRVGLFRSVGSSAASDKWFVAIDFGIGY